MIQRERGQGKATGLPVTGQDIARARARVPQADFASAAHDTDHGAPLSRLFVILSTPRSGSTFLCDLFRLNDLCMPHEYFQASEYLPLLADRWGCITDEHLDEPAYAARLVRHRASPQGWLGINLHGEHLPVFQRFEDHFAGVETCHVFVRRRNLIAQAVSYAIALQTGRWSSAFTARGKPLYRFDDILRCIDRIGRQNAACEAYLASHGITAIEMAYEDLAADPAGQFARLAVLPEGAALRTDTALRRQSSALNAEWIARFSRDYLSGFAAAPGKTSIASRTRARLRWLAERYT